MGLAASQARYLMLVARKSDLELQGQFINQARLSLAQITGSLFNLASNLDPTSQEMSAMQARIAAIQSIDKSLELMLRQVDTQREAVMTEIDAVSKVLKKNIAMSFKTFA
jgi:ATP-dependent protease ClpP protease subunit